MKTYKRREGIIAWQYDPEQDFWKWVKEANFIHKGDWFVFELNKFTVYDDETFKRLFK